ncbi:MAG: hypothetical protein RIF33_13395 [Cyclobacteriaceae bacterium]
MNKLLTLLLLTILSTSIGLKASDKVTDEIIQTMLDVKLMEDMLSKEQANIDNGVMVVDSEVVDLDLSVQKFDKPLKVIDGPHEASGQSYLMISSLDIKKNGKAVLKGTYDGSNLKFKCKQTEEGWMFTHLSIKGNGRSVFEVEF